MAPQYLWWLVAIGLGIAELATGSFYLLVLAAGAGAAGVAAAAGLSGTVQLLVAALVSAAGAILVRRRRGDARLPASMNANVNLDIGEPIQVDAWTADGKARVRYRGAEWDVVLVPGAAAVPGAFRIREIVGNRLHVGPDSPR